MRFEVVLDDRLHEHLLAHQLELSAHVGALSKTSAIGFLGDHLLRDEVVEDRLSRLLAVGLTLRRALLDDELQAGLGMGLPLTVTGLEAGAFCAAACAQTGSKRTRTARQAGGPNLKHGGSLF